MLAEANAAVPRLNPAEVRHTIGKENVLIVDVRDAPELASGGKLQGAVNVSRGMLEFRAGPESSSHNPGPSPATGYSLVAQDRKRAIRFVFPDSPARALRHAHILRAGEESLSAL
jgi:rhodanese-related sulfurtransferase